MSTLDELKKYTTVVADSGDFNQLKKYHPTDATTNPSLILKSVQKDEYRPLLVETIKACNGQSMRDIIDTLLVAFGRKILDIVPGRVSTEVDARFSFDTPATINKGRKIIKLYEQAGIAKERILIKIASTWEGIQAAEVLQKEGIHCNMTLLFSLVQAVACAKVNAQLISPFVGRIYDWYKKAAGAQWSETENGGANDPGVQSVKKIFNYYKKFGHATEVMGASFRNTSQIIELAGCDLLTISPELLEQLQNSSSPLSCQLSKEAGKNENISAIDINEELFRWELNEDAMATEKLAEGIRSFAADAKKLEKLIVDIQNNQSH